MTGAAQAAPSLSQDLFERREQAEARLTLVPLERVETRGKLRNESHVLVAFFQNVRCPAAALQEVERNRGLVGEEPEQLHLLQGERRPAVEHLQHPERALLVQERDGHES